MDLLKRYLHDLTGVLVYMLSVELCQPFSSYHQTVQHVYDSILMKVETDRPVIRGNAIEMFSM